MEDLTKVSSLDTDLIDKNGYAKWRGMLMHANFFCVIIITLAEILGFFLLDHFGLIWQPLPEYLLRFLIVPTFVNVIIILLGYVLSSRAVGKERLLNYIPVIQSWALCLVVATTHYVFSVTMCIFVVPIFVTVIFGDRRMTRNTTYFSIVGLAVTTIYKHFFAVDFDPYLIPEYVVAMAIVVATYVICKVILSFQQGKEQQILDIYSCQLEIRERLNYDQKTGLYGGTAFRHSLEDAVANLAPDQSLALAIMDLDDFKLINDAYGHACGDKVISRLANMMKTACYGTSFLPARFGGEEFVVIMRSADQRYFLDFVEKLRLGFAAQQYDFCTEQITLSAGLAVHRAGWSSDFLFDCADIAMYHSKKSGKNMTTVYNDEMSFDEGYSNAW